MSSPRFGKKNYRKELASILEDKGACFLFKEWMKGQRCEENLNFWVEVELFRKITDSKVVLKDTATCIHKKYLATAAPYMLNVDGELRDELEAKLRAGQLDTTLFDNVQQQIYSIMETSCVKRFIESDDYQHYKKGNKKSMIQRMFSKSHSFERANTPSGEYLELLFRDKHPADAPAAAEHDKVLS